MRFARRVLLAVALAGLPLGAGAQQSGVELIIEPNPNMDTGPVVAQGSGALLRLLDKSLGRSQDLKPSVRGGSRWNCGNAATPRKRRARMPSRICG